MTDRPEGFLTRWSRRKRAGKQVRRGGAAPVLPEERVRTEDRRRAAAAPPPHKAVAAGETSPVPRSPPAEREGRTTGPPDLPPVESLDKDSDFSVFMKQGVPEELRRLALRKLWRLAPGVPDGLDDYDEDYSLVGMVAEKASGIHKIGRGLRDPQHEEASRKGEEGEQERAPSPAGDEDAEAAKITDALHESDTDAAATEDFQDEPDKA